MEGHVLESTFYISEETKTKNTISDDVLFKLYNLLKKTKFDTSKWGGIDPRYLDEDEKFDFSVLTVPVKPKICGFCQ